MKKHMLFLTTNAPREAFNDPTWDLFQGKSVDDLWLPMRVTFRFFAMEALEERLLLDVKRIVENAGTCFAFPTREIVAQEGHEN